MIRRLFIVALPLLLTGCITGNTTTHSWSCRAAGNQTCASISQIDRTPAGSARPKPRASIFGGELANWWDQNRPTSVTREDGPRRESDQTMRILVAPYVDAQGDYHDRSEVFAVMRRAEWWIAPPVAVAASPKPAASLNAPAPVLPAEASTSSSSQPGGGK